MKPPNFFGIARMSPTHSPSERQSVHEFLAAIIRQAEFAAALVNHYLVSLGFRATPEQPTVFPGWFLLDLGAALQIAWWESSGMTPFIPEQLPRSKDLVRDILDTAKNPKRFATRQPNLMLGTHVLHVHLRYFAHIPLPLPAALVLGRVSEDEFVDSLARFLWESRNAGTNSGGSHEAS